MAMLQHPFIVPHVESWVTQGHTVNVVLGYCERGDLGTLLEKRKASGLATQPSSMGVVPALQPVASPAARDSTHNKKCRKRYYVTSVLWRPQSSLVACSDHRLRRCMNEQQQINLDKH